MNKLLLLVKVNLINYNNLYSFVHIDQSKKKNNPFMNIGLVTLVILALSYSIYSFVDFSMEGYIAIKAPYVVLAQFFLVTSVFILFTNIYHIKESLFTFRDYDLLMSLPINRKVILASKFINLYTTSMIYVLLFMIPCLLAHVKYIEVNFVFYLLYFLTMFIIPLIPIIVASIIGTIITTISSSFKHKNISSYIINILFIAVVFYVSFSMQNAESIDMANIGNSMVKMFNQYYPLTGIYMNIMNNHDILSLVYFLIIPIIMFSIYIVLINKIYPFVRTNLLNIKTVSDYHIKLYQSKSPLRALYIKEIKRYFSSVNYVLNTAIGCIMLMVMLFIITFIDSSKIDAILNIPNISNIIKGYAPFVLGTVCAMSCTTNSSISLEGKNLWIMKSIPVAPIKIFMSKILVNLTILIPTIIIATIFMSIYLKASLTMIILLLFTSLAYSLFTSFFGLILNLTFPDFNWTSEIKVIKQSMPSFLGVMLGILFGILPIIIPNNGTFTYVSLVTLLVFIIDLGLYLYLKNKGAVKFQNLA